MRLNAEEIQYIARKIVKTLVGTKKIEADSETHLQEHLVRVITEELQVEDKLNEEVREVLMSHSTDMERSNITYTEMFKMVKKKLAKEKGVVL